jgi:hypothetical protein
LLVKTNCNHLLQVDVISEINKRMWTLKEVITMYDKSREQENQSLTDKERELKTNSEQSSRL